MKRLFLICSMLVLFVTNQIGAQEITMFPGFWGFEYYCDDRQIDKFELESLLEKNSESINFLKKSKSNSTLAWVFIAAEFGFTIWTFNNYDNDKNIIAPAIATIGAGISALVFSSFSIKNKMYLNLSRINYSIFHSWWIDAGTPERIEELSQKLI